MANIKISQLVSATPGPNSVFPFTDDGVTYKGFVSGLTTNYLEVTKSELDSLITTSSLIPGYFYIISGVDTNLYSGTTIILESVTINKLSESGVGIFYNPKYDQSIDGFGVWTRYMTPEFTSAVNGTFQFGETVDGGTGSVATYIGEELFEWLNGQWNGARTVSGNTSGAIVSVDNTLYPEYLINDRVIWGGRHWVNLGGSISNETLGLGNSGTTYSGYTEVNPIIPGTVYIVTDIEQFSDDSFGNLVGSSGGTGTIDYNTGLWTLSTGISIPEGDIIYGEYVCPPVGNSIDKYTLDKIWYPIEFDNINYNEVVDEIKYDYENDKIIYRRDIYGNEVSCNYQVISQYELSANLGLGNPIKDFQWGNNQINWGTTPGLYLFNDVADTSDDILNGGNDLFDVGNKLNTELFTQIPYTHTQMTNPPINPLNPAGSPDFVMNGTVQPGDSYFGATSEYFTNLYPGLFVMAAHGTSVNTFYIDGLVGADCDGDLDSYQQTYTGFSTSYTVYVKRFYNNSNIEPSNNHIIIVNSDGTGISHDYNSGGCDSDLDQLSGLTASNVNRIYYLLMSQFPNQKISDEQIDEIVNVFLSSVDELTIGSVLLTLNNSYTEITNLFPQYQTLNKFGVMGNEITNSYFDCLNFLGGYIWNNILRNNSVFSNNIFTPKRLPYFSSNILSINSVFDDNVFTSNSYFDNNNIVGSTISVNDFFGNSSGNSNVENNQFTNSLITGNTFLNSSVIYNIFGSSSTITSNSISSSDLSNNIFENSSSLYENLILNSSLSNNSLVHDSSIYQNTIAGTSVEFNLLEYTSNISDNTCLSSSSIIYNNVTNNSSINNNYLSGNTNIDNNSIDQTSQILFNTGYTNSYIRFNNLFYSYISGNTINNSCFIQENLITNYSEISDNSLSVSSFISNNEIKNESYILDNVVFGGSEFYQNYIDSSYIYQNVSSASTISRNNLSITSEIYSNNLTSSNIWKNNFTIESSVFNGIFSNGSFSSNLVKNSTIDLLSSCLIDTKDITKTNFADSIVDDISETSDVIYGAYSKNVFTNSSGVTRISYYDSTDTLIIGDINDSVLPTFYISAWTATSVTDVDVTIDITNDGGSAITERGVVWSYSGYPTVSNNIIVDGGTGTGNYTNSITGITSGSTVYFRGYAVNSSGTGYTCQDNYLSPTL